MATSMTTLRASASRDSFHRNEHRLTAVMEAIESPKLTSGCCECNHVLIYGCPEGFRMRVVSARRPVFLCSCFSFGVRPEVVRSGSGDRNMAENSIQSSPGGVYFSKSIKYIQLPMSAPSQTHTLKRAGYASGRNFGSNPVLEE